MTFSHGETLIRIAPSVLRSRSIAESSDRCCKRPDARTVSVQHKPSVVAFQVSRGFRSIARYLESDRRLATQNSQPCPCRFAIGLRTTSSYCRSLATGGRRLHTFQKRKLPLFLRQEFDFAETQILGRPVLIAAAIEPEHSAAAVRKQFEVLQPKFDGELVYLRQQIDAYQRKRLIEQRVSFIVPGNQLYLPTFAIDLRDYFRKAKTATDKLSPLAQATYLYAIYHGDLLPLPLHRAAELLECSKTRRWLSNASTGRWSSAILLIH